MERIEMDDWTADLHTLIISTREWQNMSEGDRAKVPTCRCNITIGIDFATRCIVGFNLTIDAPSARGSMAAVRSIMVDKNHWARQAETTSDWPMYGRPEKIVTDGGPAFKNEEFRMAVRKALTARALPDQDPRMRGPLSHFFAGFVASAGSLPDGPSPTSWSSVTTKRTRWPVSRSNNSAMPVFSTLWTATIIKPIEASNIRFAERLA